MLLTDTILDTRTLASMQMKTTSTQTAPASRLPSHATAHTSLLVSLRRGLAHPYTDLISTVGATDLLTKSIYGGEKAVAQPNKTDPKLDFYSGGGFSNVFELPSYQAEAVTNYLTKYPPPYGANVLQQLWKCTSLSGCLLVGP